MAWYVDRWRDYLTPPSSHGWDWWEPDHSAIRRDFPIASRRAGEALTRQVAARLRAEEAARYPTLEQWLAALHSGELEAQPVEERRACSLVRDAKAYWAKRSRVWTTGPRLCRCGVEFLPERSKVVRCPACRGKAPRPA